VQVSKEELQVPTRTNNSNCESSSQKASGQETSIRNKGTLKGKGGKTRYCKADPEKTKVKVAVGAKLVGRSPSSIHNWISWGLVPRIFGESQYVYYEDLLSVRDRLWENKGKFYAKNYLTQYRDEQGNFACKPTTAKTATHI